MVKQNIASLYHPPLFLKAERLFAIKNLNIDILWVLSYSGVLELLLKAPQI